jgi:rhamnulokinase
VSRGGVFVAVDLGASSGRVVAARVGPSRLELHELHRFPNEPVALPDGLHWDILRLYREVLHGLRAAAGGPDPVTSVGVDGWGVDYGLLDETGALLGNPYSYRDARTAGVADKVHARLPVEELYARTGIQRLPFNTIYQLAAAAGTPQLEAARTLLLLPDLLGYWLTGSAGAERTNASTTALLDVRSGDWSPEALAAVGVGRDLLPALRRPGEPLGPGCPGRRWSPPSAPTTPPRRWPACPPRATASPTSPAAPGAWSGSSWRARS